MAETRPRDLTAAELELVQAPARGGNDSVPLAIPPGTQVSIELLNPVAGVAPASAAPAASPPDAAASGGVATP